MYSTQHQEFHQKRAESRTPRIFGLRPVHRRGLRTDDTSVEASTEFLASLTPRRLSNNTSSNATNNAMRGGSRNPSASRGAFPAPPTAAGPKTARPLGRHRQPTQNLDLFDDAGLTAASATSINTTSTSTSSLVDRDTPVVEAKQPKLRPRPLMPSAAVPVSMPPRPRNEPLIIPTTDSTSAARSSAASTAVLPTGDELPSSPSPLASILGGRWTTVRPPSVKKGTASADDLASFERPETDTASPASPQPTASAAVKGSRHVRRRHSNPAAPPRSLSLLSPGKYQRDSLLMSDPDEFHVEMFPSRRASNIPLVVEDTWEPEGKVKVPAISSSAPSSPVKERHTAL